MQETIKLWKELEIGYANFVFSCGGDSMNYTSMEFYDKKGNQITEGVEPLETYFNDATYENVSFYVDSDGHYQGESGTVRIQLSSDRENAEEGEEEDFTYDKSSESEWSESVNSQVEVELTAEMIDFINKNILNINGTENDIAVNYKRDFILTDKETEILEAIKEKVQETAKEFMPELEGGELEEDSCNFNTNEDGDELKIKGNNLILNISNRVTVYKQED
jgi:hypothetical protein